MTSNPVPAGLCADCVHGQTIRTNRGATFLLCRRHESDPRYLRYPRLPLLHCPGFETRADQGPDGRGRRDRKP